MSPQHPEDMISGPMFMAAYIGPSMNPTLHEPELMEILPYENRPLRAGDVAMFLPAETALPVVHRIIRVSPTGIRTRGDNNTREDAFLLQPKNILGQVVAAWRGQHRRHIAGGWPGRLFGGWLRWRRHLERAVTRLVRPLYQALSHSGLLARLLPTALRPRVVIFHVKGQEQFQLLWGKSTIGRYDQQREVWQIKRPFQLLVAGDQLPKPKKYSDKVRPNLQLPTVPPKKLDTCPAQLVLADGYRWEITSENQEAAAIVSLLSTTMRLGSPQKTTAPQPPGTLRRLIVRVEAQTAELNGYVPLAPPHNDAVRCILSPDAHWGGPQVNLTRLSLVFARQAQANGGVLLHGALAEREGLGVMMVAPGGTGKTTASNRLPAPWVSLCDDTTLVVRDGDGLYRVHPWPTWSSFQNDGPGGTWDVQKSVPLAAIFVLNRATTDRVEPVGPGQAVSLLVESVAQASLFMKMGLSREKLRDLYLERFENLCALTRVIPTHVLHISLTGAFWKDMERVLAKTI